MIDFEEISNYHRSMSERIDIKKDLREMVTWNIRSLKESAVVAATTTVVGGGIWAITENPNALYFSLIAGGIISSTLAFRGRFRPTWMRRK